MRTIRRLFVGLALASVAGAQGEVRGWLDWRGPLQAGVSLETGLIEKVELGGEGHLWSYELAGRGTPVIANGRVYALGYEGEGKDLQELLVCLDEKTGARIWDRRWNDFLSDVIYDRYSLGAPTVDPQTGNIYVLTATGSLVCFTPDGDTVWELESMTELGRLSFPNGRTGSPVVDGDLVLMHLITSHWGPNAPARDRFFGVDKRTGLVVWQSTPGINPKDSPYSHPVVEWRGGRRLLYSGTGCGNVVCIDARTGALVWRFQLAFGGVNSSTVIHGDHLIAIHGKENIDTSILGRMVSLELGRQAAEPLVLGKDAELWRNDLVAFTSSPVLVKGRAYVTVQTGELYCVDADTGARLWHQRLAPDQIHASPAYGDGKLYVPMNNGSFWILRPSDEGAETLCEVQLGGNALGAPAICNGRVYVHTTERLYCFGDGDSEAPAWPATEWPASMSTPTQLQIVPAEATYVQGQELRLFVRGLNADGTQVPLPDMAPTWTVPPILGEFSRGLDVTTTATRPGVGVLKVQLLGLTGTARVRVVPALPYVEGFDDVVLEKTAADGVKFAAPPSSWIGAGKKFEVREVDGEQVLAKTLDNPLFQRATTSIGHPSMSNYTMQVDIMTDGSRRTMSSAGVVHQRYLITLKGNHQELEVSSNVERVKETVPFRWNAKTWYTLKSRVDVAADGSGVVRVKVWKRDEPEPDEWNIEVEHKHVHANGAPGLWGFAPQSRFFVYMDNLTVTPNE
jgi:outer membrane protein assembly factor BamB